MSLGLIFLSLVILAGIIAKLEGTFLPSDTDGLSYLGHGGVWMDLTALTVAIAIIGQYADQWSPTQMIGTLLVGMAISVGAHALWAATHPPEYTHKSMGWIVRYPNLITIAGSIHLLYMSLAISLVILFYGFSSGVATNHLLAVSALVWATLLVGIFQPAYYFAGRVDAVAGWSGAVCTIFIWSAHFWKLHTLSPF